MIRAHRGPARAAAARAARAAGDLRLRRPERPIALVAPALNLSRADVHGVLTFYRTSAPRPPGAVATVQVCRGEACQAVGGHAPRRATRAPRSASASARRRPTASVTLDEVFCLGNCALGPPSRSTAGSRPGRRRRRSTPAVATAPVTGDRT